MGRALLAVVALLAVLAAPVQASSSDAAKTTPQPRVAAAAWYLVGDDGAVLATHRARQRRAIASITKLMTAVVTLEHVSPSDTVVVSERAAALGESTVFLRAGERLSAAELLRAMLVRSANDGAEALALHVGGGSPQRFVELMNAKAKELGLTDTTLRNPHGLDEPGHVSSARDATLLLRYALGIPFLLDALGRESVTLPGGRVFPSTDDLLSDWPRMLAGKTGHTAQAGWSEAGAARARGVTVYGTVLGSSSRSERNEALRSLLEHGLARYRPVVAISRETVFAEVPTGYGRPPVELVAARSAVRTMRDDVPLVQRVVAPSSASLPVREGQVLGRVEVWDRNRLVAAANLVAAQEVTEPGLLGKALWYVGATLDNLGELVT